MMKNGMNAIIDLNSKIYKHNGSSPDRKSRREYYGEDDEDRNRYLGISKSSNRQRRYSKQRKNSGKSIIHQ